MQANYPSKLLEQAVNELSKLPGIGRKTAVRLALHLLRQDENIAEALGKSIIQLRKEIIYCQQCNNISDTPVCSICSSPVRNKELICVVEDIRDVMAIENTGQYNGLYHVLGGIISPLDGIGPSDLNIDSLVEKTQNQTIKEIILALPATVEGDTTAFYLFRKLEYTGIHLTAIARGISVGDDLEYTDEITLGRSILARTPFEASLKH